MHGVIDHIETVKLIRSDLELDNNAHDAVIPPERWSYDTAQKLKDDKKLKLSRAQEFSPGTNNS